MSDNPPPDPDAARANDPAPPSAGSPDSGPHDLPPGDPDAPAGMGSGPVGVQLGEAGEPAGMLESVDAEPGGQDMPPESAAVAATRAGRPAQAVLGYLAAALVGALLLGGTLLASGSLRGAAPSPSPTRPLSVADGRTLGSLAAPVSLDIWADYQCPFCRLEAVVFGGSLERAYVLPGIARLAYHDFAFLGQESVDAAVAARCAGRQDPSAYWRYHDLLFASQKGENQGAFARTNLVALASIASLDVPSFTTCLDDPAEAKAVADETAQGRALGVASTPTLRVVGPGGTRVLTGFSDGWATIRVAVDGVLAPPSASSGPGVGTAPEGSGPPAATP